VKVEPVHHSNSYLPVQPVAPVKSKSAEAPEGAPKVKAATPPHVGKKLDIHA
jgi:hypothetical protein